MGDVGSGDELNELLSLSFPGSETEGEASTPHDLGGASFWLVGCFVSACSDASVDFNCSGLNAPS